MSTKRAFLAGSAGLALALALVPGASAGDGPRASSQKVGVTVKGRATATADMLEVEFTVAGSADDSTDAEKHYRDKRTKVLAALGGVAAPKKADDEADEKPRAKKKKPAAADEDDEEGEAPARKGKKGDSEKAAKPEKSDKPEKPSKPDKADDADAPALPATITERALAIGAKPKDKGDDNLFGRIIINGMNQNKKADPAPMQVGSLVVATIKGLHAVEREALARRVAALIDKGIEGGAEGTDGTPPQVRFLLEDHEPLRKLAYKDAMTKARARATSLADLADRKLGRVLSVQEVGGGRDGADVAPAAASAMIEGIFGSRAGGNSGPSARSLPELASEVELRVEFELAP